MATSNIFRWQPLPSPTLWLWRLTDTPMLGDTPGFFHQNDRKGCKRDYLDARGHFVFAFWCNRRQTVRRVVTTPRKTRVKYQTCSSIRLYTNNTRFVNAILLPSLRRLSVFVTCFLWTILVGPRSPIQSVFRPPFFFFVAFLLSSRRLGFL